MLDKTLQICYDIPRKVQIFEMNQTTRKTTTNTIRTMKTPKFLLFLVAIMVTVCANAQLSVTQASRVLGNVNSVVVSKGDTSYTFRMKSFAPAIADKASWMKWNAEYTKIEEMLVDSGTKFIMEVDGKFFNEETVVDTIMNVRLVRLEKFMPEALKGSYKNVYVPMYAFLKDETPQNLFSFSTVIDYNAQQAKLKALKAKEKEAGRLAKAKGKKSSKEATADGRKKTKSKKETSGDKDVKIEESDATAKANATLDSIMNIKNLWLRAFAMMKYSSDKQSAELGLPGMMWPKYDDITAVFLKKGSEHGIEPLTAKFRSVLKPKVDSLLTAVNTIYLDRGGKHIYLSTIPKDSTGSDLMIAWGIPRGVVAGGGEKSLSSASAETESSGVKTSGDQGEVAAGGNTSKADTVGDIFRHKVLSNPGKGNYELFDPNNMPSIFNPDPKWGYLLNGETGELTHLGRNLLRRDYRLARLGLLTGTGYVGGINDYGLHNSFGYGGGLGYGAGFGFQASAGFGFGYSGYGYSGCGGCGNTYINNNYYGGYGSCTSPIVSFVGTTHDVYGVPPVSDYPSNIYGYHSMETSETEGVQDPLAIADLQNESAEVSSMGDAGIMRSMESTSPKVDIRNLQQEVASHERANVIQSLQVEASRVNSPSMNQAIASLNKEVNSDNASVAVRPMTNTSNDGSNQMQALKPARTQPAFRPVNKLPNGESFTASNAGQSRPAQGNASTMQTSNRPSMMNHGNSVASRPNYQVSQRPVQQRPATARPQQVANATRPLMNRPATAQSRPAVAVRPAPRPSMVSRPQSRPASVARPNTVRPAVGRR